MEDEKQPPEQDLRLLEVLGEPSRVKMGSRQISHWNAEDAPAGNGLLHADGDGIVVARSASGHLSDRAEVFIQLERILELVVDQGLKPREIISISGESGLTRFTDRWDFSRIVAAIESQEISWVAYQNRHRIARESNALREFLKILNETETTLILADQGGMVSPIHIEILRLEARLLEDFPSGS